MNATQPVSSPIAEQCTPNALTAGVCQDNFDPNNAVPDPTQYLAAPAALVDAPITGGFEGRLIQQLRVFAQSMNPVVAPATPRTAAQGLAEAAVQVLLAQRAGAVGLPPLPQAFADLVVTGRNALANFLATRPTNAQVTALVSGDPRAAGFSPSQIAGAVSAVFSRVSSVLPAILGDVATRMAQRPVLGWIAVSGEDDLPLRPVNIPSQNDPQYTMDVSVPYDVNKYNGGTPNVIPFTIKTRFTIASSVVRNGTLDETLGFRVDPAPALPPKGPVFLYMHGHMSRLEEAGDLICAFKKLATEDAPITVVSMDLPGMGYTVSPIDMDQPAQLPTTAGGTPTPVFPATSEIHYNTAYPYLDFIAQFIVSFVGALDQTTGLESRLTAIIGGSLGGHLGLRFSTAASQFPWIRNIVTWSPISAGASVTANPLIGWLTENQLSGSGSAAEVVSTNSGKDSRSQYFNNVFDQDTTAPLPVLPPQPEMWYRDDWAPCKSVYMAESRLERREIYRPTFRQWHWRVALECVLFSFLDAPDGSSVPRYQSMTATMLLASGSKDNFFSVYIFTSTRVLASLMTAPGTSLFLLDTGHSIHNERPRELAMAILGFVNGTNPSGVAPHGFCPMVGNSVVACLAWSQSTKDTCTQGYNQTTQQCSQQQQQSSQQCSQQQQQSTTSCSQQQQQSTTSCSQQQQQSTTSCSQQQQQSQSSCSGWGPFSFVCTAWTTVVSWVCVAWTTVTNWVCVAWTTVTNWVCVAWTTVTNWVCVAWTTVTNWVCVAWAWVTNFVCQVWTWVTTMFCSLWNTITVWVCG